jgi:hypothetical protein
MARVLLLAMACGALTGCFTIRYHTRAEAEAEPRYDHWHHDALAGLLEASDAIDLSEVCPNGLARIENQVTFGAAASDFLAREALAAAAAVVASRPEKGVATRAGAGVATWYLFQLLPPWSPSSVRVWCAKGPPQGAKPPRKGLKFAVLKLQAKTGVEPSTVDLFTDALVGELRKHPGLTVISPSEIGTLLGFEREKQLLGCTDTGCLSDIAGAMGADRLVSGSVGRLGSSLVVNLSSLDPKKATSVASVSERLKRSTDEDFFDALTGFVNSLVAEQPVLAPHPGP